MKRKVRRNIQRIVISVLTAAIVLSVVILFTLSIKNLLPVFKFGSTPKDSIIKPVSDLAEAGDLSDVLSENNFIMESLSESTSSGVFIGKIKDGPRVYFSKNRDPKWQVKSLVLILNKLTIDNKKPTLVDLRYEQPIVKF